MSNFLHLKSQLVGGATLDGDAAEPALNSTDPYTGTISWTGLGAAKGTIDRAVAAARKAFPDWAARPIEDRIVCIERFAQIVKERSDDLAGLIARENGKPLWDAKTEVNSLVTKVAATLEAHEKRAQDSSREVRGLISRTRFLPHGVMAVLGPFNFPMSMPNSHIMPALLAGNTVVFKPSEHTPLAGLAMAQIWQDAGLPDGVLNCVSGGRTVGEALVEHPDVNGVLFIGSHTAGLAIRRALVDHPEKIVALEMGGNSPLVVWDYDDLKAAVHAVIQSSMVSAGQRCSAARRLIVNASDGDLVPALVEALRKIRVGHYALDPEPFYGPLITPAAAAHVVARYREIEERGGQPLLRSDLRGPISSVVLPGLIEIGPGVHDNDEEIFGPVLKVYRAQSLDEAISLSNNTKFGLAAGILVRSRDDFEKYFRAVRAGIVNWNQQLTGATTFAPFGGSKQSGNNRPAGFMSADYCSYSVASFEAEAPVLPAQLSPGLNF